MRKILTLFHLQGFLLGAIPQASLPCKSMEHSSGIAQTTVVTNSQGVTQCGGAHTYLTCLRCHIGQPIAERRWEGGHARSRTRVSGTTIKAQNANSFIKGRHFQGNFSTQGVEVAEQPRFPSRHYEGIGAEFSGADRTLN